MICFLPIFIFLSLLIEHGLWRFKKFIMRSPILDHAWVKQDYSFYLKYIAGIPLRINKSSLHAKICITLTWHLGRIDLKFFMNVVCEIPFLSVGTNAVIFCTTWAPTTAAKFVGPNSEKGSSEKALLAPNLPFWTTTVWETMTEASGNLQ